MTTTQAFFGGAALAFLLPFLVRAVIAIIESNDEDARLQRWRPGSNPPPNQPGESDERR
jgi:hypothetical protein